MNTIIFDYAHYGLNLYDYSDAASFLAAEHINDGIHRVAIGDMTLDVLVSGLEALDSMPSRSCLVVFSGAVKDRSSSSLPFFAGAGLARELHLPVIAFSDPSLALSNSLLIGWYLGNYKIPDLPLLLAQILDHINSLYSTRLIAVGGSGGGFAALNILSLMQTGMDAVVWNPQTKIESYISRVVLEYVEAAFPESSTIMAKLKRQADNLKPSDLGQALKDIGVESSLISRRSQIVNSNVIYLQNVDDWHVYAHAKPFTDGIVFERTTNQSFCYKEKFLIFFGEWGRDHSPPSRKVIISSVLSLSEGNDVLETANILANHESDTLYFASFEWDLSRNWTPQATCRRNADNLIIEVLCPGLSDVLTRRLEYTIYLIKEGERQHVFWYQQSPIFIVSLNCFDFDSIRIFARDDWGDCRSAFKYRPLDD